MTYSFFRETLDPPLVIVHGGAGFWNSYNNLSGILLNSCKKGLTVFEATKDELDAAVSAVEVLEDTCILNAGRGSTLDLYGGISMDAGVMDGSSMKYGSVGSVSYPLHPVRLARIVMEKTPHTFIVGSGADILAVKEGLDPHPGPCKEVYMRWLEKKHLRENKEFRKSDTVGAIVASYKNVGVAVSTGGTALKMPGRIGDSPLIGSGFYATNQVGVVATGIGEYISRYLLSYKVAFAHENNKDIEVVFSRFTKLFGENTAGFILASINGDIVVAYNTKFMPWIACDLNKCVGNID